MVTVHFSAELRRFTDGVAQMEFEAPDVRRLIRALDERYPGMGERLSEGTSVAIDGNIIPDAEFEDLPDGAEVHFLDTLSGG
ncbi:MAG: MoaD/ThiS family protein [Actinomycetia bacterium]|nr:MoaD/ThiS family protein [Actinomycetes bacterium]MCP3910852.1 MoaD/ThiS family protein [Actinomycetes bacterium]MCP4083670.1 MoaD/ThiS family protein [Actinomycetes bacterium]